MKKVKIMLTAITLFAVVGGALAFKAKKFGQTVYTTNNPKLHATCPFVLDNVTITDQNPGTVKISVTDVQNAPCIVTWTKAQN